VALALERSRFTQESKVFLREGEMARRQENPSLLIKYFWSLPEGGECRSTAAKAINNVDSTRLSVAAVLATLQVG
jgi:hypothetical protein